MIKGQYIYFEDKFGVVVGRVERVLSPDIISVKPFASSINNAWSSSDFKNTLLVELVQVTNIETFSEFKNLMEAHFECFL